MTASPSIWTPHLKPGERLVWSADASQALRRADLSRQRLIHGAIGGFSALVAILLAVRFVESTLLAITAPSMLAVFTPLYLVFSLTMGALALWGFRNMRARPPAATHFAITDARLIALDDQGSVIDEMPAAEVDSVVAGGRRRTPDVYVLRKDDPDEKRVFAMEHIDRPLEAKAIIEETYLLTPDDPPT